MRLLDLTLHSAEENLALDEALLDEAEQSEQPMEMLRLWESPEPVVVLGRGSQAAREVHLAGCRQRAIRVLRRSSGGAAVIIGPGSLMYALVLSYEQRPALRALDAAHRFVLDTLVEALRPLASDLARRGTSDLALGEKKFSGNSLRCKRRHFLYHGTLLYDLHLPLLDECLNSPPRQPTYRRGRSHAEFVTNLPASGTVLRKALIAAWNAHEVVGDWPSERVRRLVATRYSQAEWNHQL
jgi:lipoate-protein ligase A